MWTKFAKMSAREAMIELAGKPGYGEQPRWFEKVANAANISRRAARSIWRGEIQDRNHRAIVAVRRAAELASARKEARDLAAQYQTIIGKLHAIDPDFYRSDISRLEFVVRQLGVEDSAGTKGIER